MYGIILCSTAALSGILSYCFGDKHNAALITMLVVMGIDLFTGIIVAVMRKSEKTATGGLNSDVGWKGLAKKCVSLLVCLIAHRLDVALSMNGAIMTACISCFTLNELLSIIENCGLMGIPLPSFLTKIVDVLKHKSDSDAKKVEDEIGDKVQQTVDKTDEKSDD